VVVASADRETPGQQKPDQNGDNGDYDQQFDQRERAK